ncbi:chemotaxis protein CheD [Methanolinea mesophila]|uniref:chemotaxis protein CheD n=1 Tax=Methanolinea mesophila TaxID=547055 RepID=UPI001AE2FB54|nr:chemotaxis protein CheD [Methanolinea mesophila]MBP1927908.1 chemotaxis protein CheD [Methanolinea mesophila]
MSKEQPDPQTVIIGIGEFLVGKLPMSSIGLGSCIGLVLHSRTGGIGGMAHVMLPDSQGREDRPGKFADTAVEILVSELSAAGCRPSQMVAKIAGGASMFKGFSGNLNIGERNTEAVLVALKGKNIEVAGKDVGGTMGRTVTYYPALGGRMVVRSADGTLKEL